MSFIQTEMGAFKNQFLNDLSNTFIAEDKRGDISKTLSDAEVEKLRSKTLVLEKSGDGISITGMKTIPEPGWFWRSKQNRADNNLMRQQFLVAVLEECGVHPSDPNAKLSDLNMGELKSLAKQNLSPEILSALKLNDYGSRGRPLSVFRMQSVLVAISTTRSVDPLLGYYKGLWTEGLNDCCKKLDATQKETVNKAFDDLSKHYVKAFESCFAPLVKALENGDDEITTYANALQDYSDNFTVRINDDVVRVVGHGKSGRNVAEMGVDEISDLAETFFDENNIRPAYREKIIRNIEKDLKVNIKDMNKEEAEELIKKAVRLDGGNFFKDLGFVTQHVLHYAAVSFVKKHPVMLKYLKFGFDEKSKSFYLTNPVMNEVNAMFKETTKEYLMVGDRRIYREGCRGVMNVFSEVARQLYKADIVDGNVTWQQPQ